MFRIAIQTRLILLTSLNFSILNVHKKIRFDFLQPCLYEFDLIFQFSLFQEMTKTYILLSDWFFFFYERPHVGRHLWRCNFLTQATHTSVLRLRANSGITGKVSCIPLEGSIQKKENLGPKVSLPFGPNEFNIHKKIMPWAPDLAWANSKIYYNLTTKIEYYNP